MIRRTTCSWCHAFNVVGTGTPVFCSVCGHRGDVAMSECDCPKCRQQRAEAAQKLAELNAIKAGSEPTS